MAGMILTDAGRELITQALLGRTLTFTKVKIGEGILSGQEEKELTELISPYKEIDITKVEKAGKGLTKVRVVFSNEGFPRVVNFREVGVFAKIDDEVEVLYSYENYGDAVESIPADDGVNIVEKIIDTMNYVDDADNVTAIIDKSAVYATMVDLEEAQSALGIEMKNLENKKSNKSDIIETPNGEIIKLEDGFNIRELSKTGFYSCKGALNRPCDSSEFGIITAKKIWSCIGEKHLQLEYEDVGGATTRTWKCSCYSDEYTPWVEQNNIPFFVYDDAWSGGTNNIFELMTETPYSSGESFIYNFEIKTIKDIAKMSCINSYEVALHRRGTDKYNIKILSEFPINLHPQFFVKDFGNGDVRFFVKIDSAFSGIQVIDKVRNAGKFNGTKGLWRRHDNVGLAGAIEIYPEKSLYNWKPLPLASGISTDVGTTSQAMYCDCGDLYMFRGIVRGTISNDTKLYNLDHGYLGGIAGSGLRASSSSGIIFEYIHNGNYRCIQGTSEWVMISGIAGKA